MKLFIYLLFVTILCSGCQANKSDSISITAQKKDEQNVSVEKNNKKIILPYQYANHPYMFENHLYIAVQDNKKKRENGTDTIISYDINSGETSRIFTSEYEFPMVQGTMCNEKWLVWIDMKVDGSQEKIYAKDLIKNSMINIPKDNINNTVVGLPFLYGEFVSWIEQQQNGLGVVKLYNLKTKESKKIAQLSTVNLFNSFVDMNEGKLLWTDSKNKKGYYYLYDLSSGGIQSYSANSPYPGYAKIVGDQIFSINFPDFRRWDSQEFCAYDIKEKKSTPFDIKGASYLRNFNIAGRFLIVLDNDSRLHVYDVRDNMKSSELKVDTPVDFYGISNKNQLIIYYPNDKKEVVVQVIDL